MEEDEIELFWGGGQDDKVERGEMNLLQRKEGDKVTGVKGDKMKIVAGEDGDKVVIVKGDKIKLLQGRRGTK